MPRAIHRDVFEGAELTKAVMIQFGTKLGMMKTEYKESKY